MQRSDLKTLVYMLAGGTIGIVFLYWCFAVLRPAWLGQVVAIIFGIIVAAIIYFKIIRKYKHSSHA